MVISGKRRVFINVVIFIIFFAHRENELKLEDVIVFFYEHLN